MCAKKDTERPKLSDPAHERVRLQPRREGRVRCSAWLGVMARLQKALNPLILKLQLPQGQKDNRGSDTRYDRHIYRKPEKANAKERQIEWQYNARETNDGDKKGSMTLPVLRIILK